jgi:hypothetical protein
MSNSDTLLNAIDTLGRELDRNQPGFGAAPRPRSQTLYWVRDQICPRRAAIKRIASGDGTEIAALMIDAIVSAFTGLPWVGAQISRIVVRWGIDKFCEDPQIGLQNGENPGA